MLFTQEKVTAQVDQSKNNMNRLNYLFFFKKKKKPTQEVIVSLWILHVNVKFLRTKSQCALGNAQQRAADTAPDTRMHCVGKNREQPVQSPSGSEKELQVNETDSCFPVTGCCIQHLNADVCYL